MTATADTAPGRLWTPELPFEVKSASDGTSGLRFKGLASTWNLDEGDDIIHKGAFARTLDYWRRTQGKSNARVIPLYDGHMWRESGSVLHVVGKQLTADEQDDGLLVEFDMVPGDERAAAVHRRVKGGFVRTLSIGYQPVPGKIDFEQKDGRRIRHLREVKLKEHSVVVFPMNEGALIDLDSVKLALPGLSKSQRAELAELLTRTGPGLMVDTAPASEDTKAALRARLLQLQLRRLVKS